MFSLKRWLIATPISCLGQQQRVALARTYHQTEITAVDEPLSALDPFLRVEMHELAIAKTTRHHLYSVTHSQEEAMALADVVLVMNAGKVEQQGTPYQLFTKPKNRFVAQFIGGHNVIEKGRQPLSVKEDRIKIVTGGEDEVTSVEFWPCGPPEGEVIFRPAVCCSVRHGI